MNRDFIWPSDSSGDEEVEVVYGEGMYSRTLIIRTRWDLSKKSR